MTKLKLTLFIAFQLFYLNAKSQDILVEAESFIDKGGWVVDPQFVEQMGSPYLMAHGMGVPVSNAATKVNFQEKGTYYVWARTKNWVPGNWEAPGQFKIIVNGKTLKNTLGVTTGWSWEYAGKVKINSNDVNIQLLDLTGFNGRCDAIYFSKSKKIPTDAETNLASWRKTKFGETTVPKKQKTYDLVITGGGLAGCAAAISAAEQGLHVALIHDRPVLGGNASEEIRVHTLGIYGKFKRILKMIDTKHYPNGSFEAKYDQEKRDRNVKNFKNIDLFLNWRAYDAKAKNNIITHVDARHTTTGERIRFTAPRFVDSTGDGWIGFWAGAKFSYGRESASTYGEAWDEWGELWSPEKADNFVMGSSVLWQNKKTNKAHAFPQLPWASSVAKDHKAIAGEWYWEFSRNDLHQINDAEEIRDHMLRAIFGSFANAKKMEENKNYKLQWVSYLVGKRESRRLLGDYIYTFNDVKKHTKFKDAVVEEVREVDVHYQRNLKDGKQPDFLSEAIFYETEKYYIPYRSLYSKNIKNLFMAGRNFSCSHVGLGGPRVMLTTGQMGAAVGLAATICKKYGVNPREVYTNYLQEYLNLIEKQQ
ncbi:FAD-dependent oxidoreductase [Polaribacter batillariae]|uniref:FAD-dependent oxidoreductase n=1 Tax=Polaribacter batillariae TaxID=2808900 RepID=A0ABX7T053_9FLAO|nr:FAD-dependent oxidoreductase [Polaribacter batillariae]QTD38458.1 FAD-dependent oxidoreductase [Polaribacter batillariae]